MRSESLQCVPPAHGLGYVDLDFECSTVCPILLGLTGIWQKQLGSWASWWNTEIKVNPTQVRQEMGHPVCTYSISNPSYTLTNLEFGASRKYVADEALAVLHGVDDRVEGHGKILSGSICSSLHIKF